MKLGHHVLDCAGILLDDVVEILTWSTVTRPMLNFKSFRSAGNVLADIALIHMIRKAWFAIDGAAAMSFAENPSRAQQRD